MLELALRAFLTLLVVVDPVGIAPVYLGLVAARPRAEQASLMILVGHAGPDPRRLAVVFAMTAAVLGLTWLALRLSTPLGRALGRALGLGRSL